MRCPLCHSEMLLLFTSYLCERCDTPPSGRFYVGFVVWRGIGGPRQEYLFRTRADAGRWREINGLLDSEVRPVLVEAEPAWHLSRGSIRDLELANQLFEIFPTHRFPPAPNRGFLAPETVNPRDQGFVELSQGR